MAGIPQVDDDAESAMLRGSNLSETVNEMQAAEIKKLLELTGADTKKFLQHYRANSVDEMLAINYSKALAALQSKVK
jgi:folate-binding Fe-S cluster repair protein YgfZ